MQLTPSSKMNVTCGILPSILLCVSVPRSCWSCQLHKCQQPTGWLTLGNRHVFAIHGHGLTVMWLCLLQRYIYIRTSKPTYDMYWLWESNFKVFFQFVYYFVPNSLDLIFKKYQHIQCLICTLRQTLVRDIVSYTTVEFP